MKKLDGGSVAVHAIEAIALGFLHDLRSDNDIYTIVEQLVVSFVFGGSGVAL